MSAKNANQIREACPISVPKSAAQTPSTAKVRAFPSAKVQENMNAFFVSFSLAPPVIAITSGMSGSTQGEKDVITPAKNTIIGANTPPKAPII